MIKRKTKNSTERQRVGRNLDPRQSQSDSASTKKAAETKRERKARQGRAVAAKRGTRKVWHISRFTQRYELPDDVRYSRRSPLQYTKDFCSGQDDESCSYFRALMTLRSKADWLTLRGIFAELKAIAGNMSKLYRGYLLAANYKPATNKDIGCWLGLQNGQAKHALKGLASVGLIEQVTAPNFERMRGKKNKPKKRRRQKREAAKQDNKHTRPKKDVFRARTETTGNPLRAKINVKLNINDNINGTGKREEININGNGNAQLKANALEGQTQRQALPPTAELPSRPKKADPGGGAIRSQPNPLGPDNRSGAVKLGEILSGMQHRYDPDAKSFARDVFLALGLTCAPDSRDGRRELGCFASLWMQAQRTIRSPPALAELHEKAIADAVELSKRRTKYRNLSATWTAIFKKRINGRRM